MRGLHALYGIFRIRQLVDAC